MTTDTETTQTETAHAGTAGRTGVKFTRVFDILERHRYQKARLIPILHEVQKEYTFLPEDVLTTVATALELPPAHVYGVATFYAHFSLEPKGKYRIRLCDGTACHVKGSEQLLDAIRRRLKLTGDRKTTPDMLFTVETVSCLGACGLAPALVINDDVHGQVTPERAVALVEAILDREGRK